MNILTHHFSKLATLESFDHNAFKPDNHVSKDICGFILSLSLIHNDLKNTFMFMDVIDDSKPDGEYEVRKDWGEHRALRDFIDRVTLGILHELFNLIEKNKGVLENKFFEGVIKSISKESKEFWKALVDTSFQNYNDNKLAKDLKKIRNNVSFHYGPKAIFQGYENFFEKIKKLDLAYISRGYKMIETRFYFADAAAQGCMHHLLGQEDIDYFFEWAEEILLKLNHTIFLIINSFINKRGYAFKEVKIT
jgi:hypothetical protein